MKSLLQLFVLISCTLVAGCQSDENPIVSPKIDLTIANNFDLFEILTSDFSVHVSNGKTFQGNKVKAISTNNYVHSSWYIDSDLQREEHSDSFEFLPVSDHTVGYRGTSPEGYDSYTLTIDTSLFTTKINLINYRESNQNEDYNSPFNLDFEYSGVYSYSDSLNNSRKVKIIDTTYDDSHLMLLSIEGTCFPSFYITKYALNGFYSDLHTNIVCQDYYKGEIFATLISETHLDLKIKLKNDTHEKIYHIKAEK
jgi:hypothetical protein